MEEMNKEKLQSEYCNIRHLLSTWDKKPLIPSNIEEKYLVQIVETAKFTEFVIDLILEHIYRLEHVLIDSDATKEQYQNFINSLSNLYKKIEQYKQSINYTDKDKKNYNINGENARQELSQYANRVKEAIDKDLPVEILLFNVVDAEKLFNRIGILKKVYTSYKNAFNEIGSANPELKDYIDGSFNSIDLLFMIQKYMTLKNKNVYKLIVKEDYYANHDKFVKEKLYPIVKKGFIEKFEEDIKDFYDRQKYDDYNWEYHNYKTINQLGWYIHCRSREQDGEKRDNYLVKCLEECTSLCTKWSFVKESCRYLNIPLEEFINSNIASYLRNCFETVFAEYLADIIKERSGREFTYKNEEIDYSKSFDEIGTWKNPLDYINDGINPGQFDEQFKRFILNVQLPGKKNRSFEELYREKLVHLKSLGLTGVDLKREQVKNKAKVTLVNYLMIVDLVIQEFKNEFEQILLYVGNYSDCKQYKESLIKYEKLLIDFDFDKLSDNKNIISSDVVVDMRKLKEIIYTLISAINNVCKDNKSSRDIVSARLVVLTNILGALIFVAQMYESPDEYFSLSRVESITKEIDEDEFDELFCEFDNLDDETRNEILEEVDETGLELETVLALRKRRTKGTGNNLPQ